MPSIDSLDFLNANALRNFPLKEGVSRVSTLGEFTIPNDFIVDLQVAVSYDPAKRYYISRIVNFEDVITIEISNDVASLVGSFSIVKSNHWQYKEYLMSPADNFNGAVGVACITSLTSMGEQPQGAFLFTLASAELEARCSVPALKGINRLVFQNTTGESYSLSGDVIIEARQNLRFKLDPDVENKIILDAGNGLGLNTICSDELKCIKTINGIPPDSDGNFTLDFSDCATLTPIPAGTGLLLEDICCKPCVGCNDIEELTTRLMTTETGLLQLRNYYDSLLSLFTDFKTTATFTCDCPPED